MIFIKSGILNKNNVLLDNVILNNLLVLGIETNLYRKSDYFNKYNIVLFPIHTMRIEMNIKEVCSSNDLYELLYQIEDIEKIDNIVSVRVNNEFPALDMEMVSYSHGNEYFKYYHLVVEINSKIENGELLDIVIDVAESTFYLQGFQYIVYLNNMTAYNNKEIHILINHVSLRGEPFAKRKIKQMDFEREIRNRINESD